MYLLYKEEKTQLNRDNTAYTTILEKVNELIKQENTVFSHLTIDEIDIYENHETYINERINEIMKIEIITRTTNEMIWETMGSVHEYLERAIPALSELVDQSYEGFTKKTWTGIEQLTDGMQWMLQFVEFTRKSEVQPKNWDNVNKSFENCEKQFAVILEATEAQDTVLISDLLTYEIIPAYESLKDSIAVSLQDKEFLNDVN